MTTLKDLASTALSHLETRKRADGTEFWCQKDDAPDWVTDLCCNAHGDMCPDDHRYRFISDALIILSDTEDEDEWANRIDSDVDVYNHDLLTWVASRLDRMVYVDEAVDEYGWPDEGLARALMMGQYREREEVLRLVRGFLWNKIAEEANTAAGAEPITPAD